MEKKGLMSYLQKDGTRIIKQETHDAQKDIENDIDFDDLIPVVQDEVAKSIDIEEYDKLLFASPELNKGAHHLLDSDPYINLYNMTGFSMLPNIVATNLNLKEYIQEFIEEYVAELVNEEDEENEED